MPQVDYHDCHVEAVAVLLLYFADVQEVEMDFLLSEQADRVLVEVVVDCLRRMTETAEGMRASEYRSTYLAKPGGDSGEAVDGVDSTDSTVFVRIVMPYVEVGHMTHHSAALVVAAGMVSAVYDQLAVIDPWVVMDRQGYSPCPLSQNVVVVRYQTSRLVGVESPAAKETCEGEIQAWALDSLLHDDICGTPRL